MAEGEQGDSPLRVLIVDDEMLICMTLQDVLEDLGSKIVASCTTLQQAIESSASLDFDVAILDVNLNGVEVTPVSAALQNRNIPFVFSTGYGKSGIPQQYSHYPLIEKPFRDGDVMASLRLAMRGEWKHPPTSPV